MQLYSKFKARDVAGLRWSVIVAWAAGAAVWFDPSSGLTTAILSLVGMAGLVRARATMAAWRQASGYLFGAGVLWAILSCLWSFYPEGSSRDLVKALPLALAVGSIPLFVNRAERVWTALWGSAALVTVRLVVEFFRLVHTLGWADLFEQARFTQTYLYTHPNVSSMMAGLCLMIFAARLLAGVPELKVRLALLAGIMLNVVYLVVMASRGPQAVLGFVLLLVPVLLAPGWRSRVAMLVLAVALGAGLWPLAQRINPRFADKTASTFNERDKIWAYAKALGGERPLLGHGFGKKAFVKAIYEHPDHLVPHWRIFYPHAHSYWLMLYFQGGAVGLGLWGGAWLLLFVRLSRRLSDAGEAGLRSCWPDVQARVLPALLMVCLTYVLLYGLVDYPDNVLRQVLFYLAGLATALIRLPPARSEDVA